MTKIKNNYFPHFSLLYTIFAIIFSYDYFKYRLIVILIVNSAIFSYPSISKRYEFDADGKGTIAPANLSTIGVVIS